jgi:hypothetical protein
MVCYPSDGDRRLYQQQWSQIRTTHRRIWRNQRTISGWHGRSYASPVRTKMYYQSTFLTAHKSFQTKESKHEYSLFDNMRCNLLSLANRSLLTLLSCAAGRARQQRVISAQVCSSSGCLVLQHRRRTIKMCCRFVVQVVTC